MTSATGLHLDQNFIRCRDRALDILDRKRMLKLAQHGSLHGLSSEGTEV
jgi:hypothetical protein